MKQKMAQSTSRMTTLFSKATTLETQQPSHRWAAGKRGVVAHARRMCAATVDQKDTAPTLRFEAPSDTHKCGNFPNFFATRLRSCSGYLVYSPHILTTDAVPFHELRR